MKASEAIREGRNLLFERGWCQNALEEEDGSVCALGALNLAESGNANRSDITDEHLVAWRALLEAVGQNIVSWNNIPGRKFDEVIDAFDRAEKIAEQREANDA